jgi:hypothetical protein
VDEVVPGFEPESELERRLARDPELLAGLDWGRPRKSHPEGSVGRHVADLLRRLDLDRPPAETRRMLRFIVLVHDAFKFRVQRWRPRTGENHHAMRARRFAERFIDDERVLATIELHDRPYALWRGMQRTGKLDEKAFERLLARIDDPELFLRFIELDGATEGKNSEPIRWLREELRRRGLTG